MYKDRGVSVSQLIDFDTTEGRSLCHLLCCMVMTDVSSTMTKND